MRQTMLTRENIVNLWIPEEHEIIEGSGYVVYLFNSKRDGRPFAAGFVGKQSKPLLWSVYPDEERRDLSVSRWIEGQKESARLKAERREARKVKVNPFKVGDILYNSWGYDQTNVDFYQVTKVNKASVYIRSIAQRRVEDHGWMCGTCEAIPDKFIGDPILKRVSMWNGKGFVSFKHGGCSLWEGKPVGWSGYA